MITEIKTTGIDPQEETDRDAVYRHAFGGEPLAPEIRRRVQERAAEITDQIFRTHGLIDDQTFQKLLSDDDDKEL
jgi:hypothetical protein